MGEIKSSADWKACMRSGERESQFKGVVPQHNKKWGAQIYVRHSRLWLGTFMSQEAAALAYDRACLNYKGAQAPKNFLTAEKCQIESMFQERYKKEHVVQMIREHTYDEHFTHFMATHLFQMPNAKHDDDDPQPEHLFDKEVTPSDVGKLNRLVIPKQHAEKYLEMKESLVFVDVDNDKVWEFRYSFWKSSQSYVLTRGWSKFVKEKRLEAGDIVSFHRCKTTAKLYISVTLRSPSRRLHLVRGRLLVNHNCTALHFDYSSNHNHNHNGGQRQLTELSLFPLHGSHDLAHNNGGPNHNLGTVKLFGAAISYSNHN